MVTVETGFIFWRDEMKSIIIAAALGLAIAPAAFADQQKNASDKDAKLQQELAATKCATGTPVLKEVTKTVFKTVAGRMIPTAVHTTKVVCR